MKKFIEYLKIGIAAIVKFTVFPYAAQITVGFFGLVVLVEGFPLLALLIEVWAGVLAVREYQLRKK
jgi:hypothetical protein